MPKTCPVCFVTFDVSNKYNLRAHIEAVHPAIAQRMYACQDSVPKPLSLTPSFTATAPIEARSRSVSTQTPRPVVFDVESSSSPCTAVMPRFHNTLARIKSRLDDSLLLISRDHPDVDLSYLREVFATMVINHEGRTCRLYELPC